MRIRSTIRWLSAGEILARLALLPIPGPVIGLMLLHANLIVRNRLPDDLGALADRVLQLLGMLFVPAGVGVIAYLDLLRAETIRLAQRHICEEPHSRMCRLGHTLLSAVVFIIATVLRRLATIDMDWWEGVVTLAHAAVRSSLKEVFFPVCSTALLDDPGRPLRELGDLRRHTLLHEVVDTVPDYVT